MATRTSGPEARKANCSQRGSPASAQGRIRSTTGSLVVHPEPAVGTEPLVQLILQGSRPGPEPAARVQALLGRDAAIGPVQDVR